MEQSDLPPWTSTGSAQGTRNLWRCSRILFNQSKSNNMFLLSYYTVLYISLYGISRYKIQNNLTKNSFSFMATKKGRMAMIQSQWNISGLNLGDHITYLCEIGNFHYYTSEIRNIIMDDDNPLKLDKWGYVRYHNSLIQKCKTLVNGRLEDYLTS
jgi:hypothetical protein